MEGEAVGGSSGLPFGLSARPPVGESVPPSFPPPLPTVPMTSPPPPSPASSPIVPLEGSGSISMHFSMFHSKYRWQHSSNLVSSLFSQLGRATGPSAESGRQYPACASGQYIVTSGRLSSPYSAIKSARRVGLAERQSSSAQPLYSSQQLS